VIEHQKERENMEIKDFFTYSFT